MDRGKSRSTPYLPRYQSLSPARSPQLDRYRFLSQRSGSQPSQRIYYIDSEPTRVINSYHVHHSPSPNRTYKIHLCSSKTNHYLTRVTRSQSAYDINSSHVYTSQENLVGNSIKEAAARRAGSCEDIYHKAPFFPDTTPSESGVSFGESEEGSAFGGEDDNVSQHSFDSSGAYYEITVDSELDKCDSDNFSGPDYVKVRATDTKHDVDRAQNSGKRKPGPHRFYHEPHSPDNTTSHLSYAGSRRRELVSSPSLDFDKYKARSEVLRVIIPDEKSVKTSRDSNKIGDRRVISSNPLAHSTPHVSPGGPGELKLQASTSWNADSSFGDNTDEARKQKTAGALFDQASSAGHSSKLDDSSCYSSCSDDNYSDVSNTTISSDVPRKIKLVKKHSDKPASAKINSLSYVRDLSSVLHTEKKERDKNTDTAQRRINTESDNEECKDYRGFPSSELNTLYNQDQTTTFIGNSIKDEKPVSKDNVGSEWWTDYAKSTTNGQVAKLESRKVYNEETLISSQRDARNAKALTVNIPLISAGKYGQEKLRQLSQTSPPLDRSPDKSPTLSPTGTVQILEKDKNENHIACHSSQVNIDDCEEPQGHSMCGSKTSDNDEYQKCQESENEEGKMQSFPSYITRDHSPMSPLTNENNQYSPSVGEIPPIGKIPQNEQCLEFFPEALENMHSKWEQKVTNWMLGENDGSVSEVTKIEGNPLCSIDEMENLTCKRDNFHSHVSEISCGTSEIVNDTLIANSEDILLVDMQLTSVPPVKYADMLVADSLVTEHTVDSAKEISDSHIHDQRAKPQSEAWASCDELDSVREGPREMGKTSDKFSTNANASLPVPAPQVLDPSLTVGKSSHLNASVAGNKKELDFSENNTQITVLGETVSDLESSKCIDIFSSERTCSSDNVSSLGQGQFNAGLCSDNIVSLEGSDNALFIRQPCIAKDVDVSNSCDFTESIDRLFVESSSSKTVIDSVVGSSVITEDEHQTQTQPLSSSFQNMPIVDAGFTGENTGMGHVVEPCITSTMDINIPNQFGETPQVVMHVSVIEDSIANSECSPQQHARVTHQLTGLLTSSDLYKNTERTEISIDYVTNIDDTRDNFHQQLFVSSDSCENNVRNSDNTYFTRNTLNQQEDVVSDLYTDNTRSFDESIKQTDGAAQRDDRGTNKEEHFCTEKYLGFIERGEEFMYCPDTHRISLIATDVSSRRIEHIQHTSGDKVVSTEVEINNFPQGLNSCDNCAGVDIVNDKSVTGAVIKEQNECAVITPAVNSDTGKQETVSTETNSLDAHTSTICLPLSSTAQGLHDFHHSVASEQPSSLSSSLVSGSRMTYLVTSPALHVLKANVGDLNQNNTTSDLVQADRACPFVSEVSKINPEDVLIPTAVTYRATMHHHSPLDNLQEQLSLISGDTSTSSTRTYFTNGSDEYEDHAEATSVLKQIVRGDTGDFTNFSHTSCEIVGGMANCLAAKGTVVNVTGEISEPMVASVEDNILNREHYDNDYDYVTTDLPKESKLNSRPQHHVHLLKPSQLKTSSLWTLQEETENVIDATSPKSSPKLSRATSASKEVNFSLQLAGSPQSLYKNLTTKGDWVAAENKAKNLVSGDRTLASESSDFEDSDGNYSSISTSDTDSRRSCVFGREQTSPSEVESVAVVHETDSYKEAEKAYQRSDNCRTTHFYEHIPELEPSGFTMTRNSHISEKDIEDSQISPSMNQGKDETPIKTYKSIVTFCVNSPEGNEMTDSIALLDRLTASLEEFSTTDSDNGDWKSMSETEESLSSSRESNLNVNNTQLLNRNDKAEDATSGFQYMDLNRPYVSTSNSPIPMDYIRSNKYTCTGKAEVKKISSYHYDISANTSKISHSSPMSKTVIVKHDDKLHNEKAEKFEKILDEFNKGVGSVGIIPEFVFLSKKRSECSDSSASSSEDLYKTFTNDESEKKQNHVCIVIEDENMNTFRFKRYLKKSHTKRRKGRKVFRFLSKLGCVSESLSSPIGSPNPRIKRTYEDVQTFSTDSMNSSKPRISNPILINSTSFHVIDILTPTPLINVGGSYTRFSSSRSLDSLRSGTDSAYSSISESAAGDLNSPAYQRVPSNSFRFPRASSGSISSVFCSGSTSGDRSFSDSVFSSSSDTAVRTLSSLSEDFTRPVSNQPDSTNSEVMSSLSEVFDQLKVCEDEIDSARLNRMWYGHTQAEVNKN